MKILKFGLAIFFCMSSLESFAAAEETPLHNALGNKDFKTVLFLLAQPDTDVNERDQSGRTILHIFARTSCHYIKMEKGYTEVFEALLAHPKTNIMQKTNLNIPLSIM